MTKAVFYTQGGMIIGFDVHDHTDYAESGEDIVCSAISSSVILAANILTEQLEVGAYAKSEDKHVVVKIPLRYAKVCRHIFMGLKAHLLEIEAQYYDYLEVKVLEV